MQSKDKARFRGGMGLWDEKGPGIGEDDYCGYYAIVWHVFSALCF